MVVKKVFDRKKKVCERNELSKRIEKLIVAKEERASRMAAQEEQREKQQSLLNNLIIYQESYRRFSSK